MDASAAAASGEPSTTICVANLPDLMTPREFRLLFKFANGVERCVINHTKTGRQVGYARFATAQDAQAALEWLNGFPMDEELTNTAKVFMSSTQLRDAPKRADPGFGGPGAKFAKGGGKGMGFAPYGMGMGMPMGMGMGAPMGMGMGAPMGMGMGFGMPMGMGFGKGKGKGKGAVTSPNSVYVGGIPHDWDEATLQSLFEGFGTVTKSAITRGSNPVGNIGFIHYATPAEAQAAIQNMNNYQLGDNKHLVVRANTSRPQSQF